MSKMSYYDMNKCLCKQLCEEFEKFENDPNEKYLHGIHKLIESMVGLTELEAAGAMREYLEDEHGYDSRSGEFRERDWSRPYRVWNAARPYPMTTPPYYGGDYDMDGRYMNRVDGMDGRRDMDGDTYNRGRDSRGRYNDGRGMDVRTMNGYGIYNMAHKDGMKRKDKLTDSEIKEWMESLESETGERGPMWSREEIEAVAKKEGIAFDKFSASALYAMTNVMYSDYCRTGEKYHTDTPGFYMSLAVDFLTDPDAVGGGDNGDKKVAIYYEEIAEH